jgi:hypothetical protein
VLLANARATVRTAARGPQHASTRHGALSSPHARQGQGAGMSAFLLWLLLIAVGVYLLIAMLRPDKF